VLVVERKPDQPSPGGAVQQFQATTCRPVAAICPLPD
jgi:hypothetical protein